MYVKWIVCEVDDADREAFKVAQMRWGRICEAAGFVAQVGGWAPDRPEACILGFWEDKASCDRFMATLHDTIVEETRQDLTYRSSRIVHATSVMQMRGEAATLREAIANARVLRVANCEVHAARCEHFTSMQRDVWEPAMAEAPGQLGGFFSRCEQSPLRFIVTTFWRGEESHAAYARDRVASLRDAAEVSEDVAALCGWSVRLEAAWRVTVD